MNGFKKFLLRGNVVDLAVAVVIGGVFGAVVTSFVSAFITPLVGVFTGGSETTFAQRTATLFGEPFPYGQFIDALLRFLIVTTVVYFLVVKPVQRLMDVFRTEPDPAQPTKKCPECLSAIPEQARRCAFCTSQQPAATASPA